MDLRRTRRLLSRLQGLTELLVARNYGAALIFITPLALLLGQVAHPQPVGTVIVARVLETVVGVAIGLAVAVLTYDGKDPSPVR